MGGKGRGWGQDGSNRPQPPLGLRINVDNHLQSWEIAPIFALYPQISPSMARNWSLKDRFRPQPVDNFVGNFLGLLARIKGG